MIINSIINYNIMSYKFFFPDTIICQIMFTHKNYNISTNLNPNIMNDDSFYR